MNVTQETGPDFEVCCVMDTYIRLIELKRRLMFLFSIYRLTTQSNSRLTYTYGLSGCQHLLSYTVHSRTFHTRLQRLQLIGILYYILTFSSSAPFSLQQNMFDCERTLHSTIKILSIVYTTKVVCVRFKD